jgi:hypothetical protein
MSDARPYLIRQLLTICPICKKPIYGKDIGITKIDKSKIKHWPLRYTICHEYGKNSMHALTIYLDNNFHVRGNEISDFIQIEK